MSSTSRRTLIAALALLPLAGCGFAPAYGPDGAGAALQGRVELAAPRTRNDFDLAEQLENRLGAAATPGFRLTTRIETQEVGTAYTGDETATRKTVTGSVSYALTDLAGATLAEGKVTGFTAYSTLGTVVSDRATREDAYQRLMVILADQIVTRLLASRLPAQ